MLIDADISEDGKKLKFLIRSSVALIWTHHFLRYNYIYVYYFGVIYKIKEKKQVNKTDISASERIG